MPYRSRRPNRRNSLKRLLLGVACTAIACGVLSPEEQLLTDFFEAARVYDTAVMARLSAVPMNPRADGIVDRFTIRTVDRSDTERERVTVSANVRGFDGKSQARDLVFTVTHRDGRWFIQEWR